MTDISRTAKSMEYAFGGISNKFQFQRNMSDANMLAKARAFYTESLAYNADFIAYGLPSTLRADPASCATPARGGVAAFRRRGCGSDTFEASFSNAASATAYTQAATADEAAKVRVRLIIVRTLDGIVRNKYANDPGKLAAWISASHVEKAPKKKDPTP